MSQWAVIGAGGQLGRAFVDLLGSQAIAFKHENLEVTDHVNTCKALSQFNLRGIINCSAYNLVDKAEDEPELAVQVNGLAVMNLARFCQEKSLEFVHYSTNYVFDGLKEGGYKEEDPPSPQSVYAVSKLLGENFARDNCKRSYVIRTAAVFGTGGNKSKGGNFIDRMIEKAGQGAPLEVVNDQFVSPTFANDLAKESLKLIESLQYGLCHITNKGAVSWYDYARFFLEQAGIKANLEGVSSKELAAKAKRPRNGLLDCSKFERIIGFELRSWEEAVKEYLAQIKLA